MEHTLAGHRDLELSLRWPYFLMLPKIYKRLCTTIAKPIHRFLALRQRNICVADILNILLLGQFMIETANSFSYENFSRYIDGYSPKNSLERFYPLRLE